MSDGDGAQADHKTTGGPAGASGDRPTGELDDPQPTYPDSLAQPEELLIHPDDEPDHGSPDPFGTPGDPISRHSPFYVGFFGGVGILIALVIGLAIRQVQGANALLSV